MQTLSLGERIKLIRQKLGFKSQNDLAATLDMDTQRIQNLESGRLKNLFGHEALLFETKLRISGWWLISGAGHMMLEDNSAVETIYQSHEYQIKILPGSLEKSVLCLDRNMFNDSTIPCHNLRAIKMTGDSMQPTLNNGDWLIIDITGKAAINGLYVIMVNEEFLVYRLTFLLDGTIELSSDNATYKPQTINKEAITIIGMATLIIKNC